MKYKDPTTGDFKELKIRATDELPVGSEIDVADNTTIPAGWEQTTDPNAYSTEEQRIGTWIDGKPLYRRAFIQNISSQTVARIATLSDIDNIFITDKSTTIIKESSHHFFVPVSTYETSNNFSKFYVDKTVSDNSAKLNWAGNSTSGTLIAVVEYTKTTD